MFITQQGDEIFGAKIETNGTSTVSRKIAHPTFQTKCNPAICEGFLSKYMCLHSLNVELSLFSVIRPLFSMFVLVALGGEPSSDNHFLTSSGTHGLVPMVPVVQYQWQIEVGEYVPPSAWSTPSILRRCFQLQRAHPNTEADNLRLNINQNFPRVHPVQITPIYVQFADNVFFLVGGCIWRYVSLHLAGRSPEEKKFFINANTIIQNMM